GRERVVAAFLAERESWIRRHLNAQQTARARLDARPSLEDGRTVPYLGLPHRVRVGAAGPGARSSRVSRVGGDEGAELVVERSARARRPTSAILEAWFQVRAGAALDAA